MASKVIETAAYKLQAAKILNQIQQQSIVTFLTHYTFEGDEIKVGEFNLLTILWDAERNIRITYAVVPDDFTVFLLSVTQGDVVFQSTKADEQAQFAKQLGIGISTKLIADFLFKLANSIGDWF